MRWTCLAGKRLTYFYAALTAPIGIVLTALPAHAIDGQWLNNPINNEWTNGPNWSSSPIAPDGTATFGASSITTVNVSSSVSINSLQFTSSAPAYSFTVRPPGPLSTTILNVNGSGIVSNSAFAPTFIFSTGAALYFNNASSAGNAIITSEDRNAFLRFTGTSSAASATISASLGLVRFLDNSTASNANLQIGDALFFSNNSSAGNARITLTSQGPPGQLEFYDASTAANATIINNFRAGSFFAFHDESNAGSAAIANNQRLFFNDRSSAGHALITTSSGARTAFFGRSTPHVSQLVTEAGGVTDFSQTTGSNSDRRLTVGSIAGAGSYVLGPNELTVGANDLSTAVSGVISGVGGSLVKTGSGFLTLSGINTYTGRTVVEEGALVVDGSIASSSGLTISSGAVVGGTGILPSTIVNSGATLAPGYSIGTLNVSGTLVFSTAATYMVEIDPTSSDRTNVTGRATLGGARVSAVYAAGSYVPRSYTILNAQEGVVGTFGALVNTNLPATFAPSLRYDANNVYLDLALAFGPTGEPDLSGNQASVANALVNSFTTAGGIPLALGALTAQGLTQVSGEAATGAQQTTFNAMDQFITMMTDPFLGTRAGGMPQTSTAGYADENEAFAYASKRSGAERDAYAAFKAPPRAESFEPRGSVWASGYGGTQRTDGNPSVGSNDVTSRIYGGAAGFDYRLTPDTLVGFSLGGAGTSYGLANGLGGGRSEMFQAGAYARHNVGAAYFAGALVYGWQDITTDRTVFGNVYRANFDANSFAGRLEGGYRFAYGASGLTPYGAGQLTSVWLPAYAEQTIAGTNIFALGYGTKDVTTPRSELGLRGDTSFVAADAIVTLRGRAAWAHNFNTDRSIGVVFQSLPASAFVVNGAAQAHDSALVSAGAEAKWLNGFSVAAAFEGEFSRVSQSYGAKGSIRYQW